MQQAASASGFGSKGNTWVKYSNTHQCHHAVKQASKQTGRCGTHKSSQRQAQHQKGSQEAIPACNMRAAESQPDTSHQAQHSLRPQLHVHLSQRLCHETPCNSGSKGASPVWPAGPEPTPGRTTASCSCTWMTPYSPVGSACSSTPGDMCAKGTSLFCPPHTRTPCSAQRRSHVFGAWGGCRAEQPMSKGEPHYIAH